MDIHATGEVFISQKKTSSTSTKPYNSSFLCVIFALLDPDPADKNECGFWSGSTILNCMIEELFS
jgi:hypothetical protein